ncbi:MAG TPA: O-antigen ligase family protein [Roseiflexaceae bacterium]|nr:O-antigen ligase family protein [Roseiflexaceae bacterium]
MITTIPIQPAPHSGTLQRRQRWMWALLFVGLNLLTLAVGLLMLRRGPAPTTVAWLLYLAGLAAIVCRPRWGVYLIVGLTLAGDDRLTWWYPFTKNFSSQESLLYAARQLIFSPLETYIVATFAAWLISSALRRRLVLRGGPLLGPALLFIACISFGLLYGVMRGGNLNIALWEARSIYYLPAMLVLATNLIRERDQVHRLIWIAGLAVALRSLSGLAYVANELHFQVGTVQSIAEHAFSIHASSFFVLLIAAWLFRDTWTRRLGLLLLLTPVLISYAANQRRAGFVVLAVGLALVAVVLYRERPRVFWVVVPTALLAAAVFLAATWNAGGAIGMPARAVKSVIAPEALSARDTLSNSYRVIENINIKFTITRAPLTGVGFGQKFFTLVPLPDISFFVWHEYITHNSILWIWMKAGIGGFLSLLLLIWTSVAVGVRALWRLPGDSMSAAALTALLYVIMHFLYAYVDMSWDIRSMVYVGTMLGVLNLIERVALDNSMSAAAQPAVTEASPRL